MSRTYPPLRDRVFASLIMQPNGCLEWQRCVTPFGYGQLRGAGQAAYVHRLMYEWFVGPIEPGTEIDHLCKNPRCAAPSHLEAVTHHENILRGASGAAVNARKTHCVRGHPFDAQNTYVYPSGKRSCIMCSRQLQRERRAMS